MSPRIKERERERITRKFNNKMRVKRQTFERGKKPQKELTSFKIDRSCQFPFISCLVSFPSIFLLLSSSIINRFKAFNALTINFQNNRHNEQITVKCNKASDFILPLYLRCLAILRGSIAGLIAFSFKVRYPSLRVPMCNLHN